MSDELIRCRAQRSDDCYDGRPTAEIYEDGNMAEDGTFERRSGTVVCDACYVWLTVRGFQAKNAEVIR